ncbi:hypothetical protein PCASD_13609, partial [Puccinia coronata f. sp. avenae]
VDSTEEEFQRVLSSSLCGPASFLMIFAQVGLLRISLKYQTPSKPDSSASNMSILSSYSSSPSYSFDYYIDFLALLFSLESVLFILFQRYDTFIQAMGFFSLGLESTLPIPQLITNFRRKSLAGLSSMVLFGWLFGDSFKSIYLVFLMPNSNSIQFKICALFQLSIDILILSQSVIYRRQTKLDNAADQEEEEDQVAQQIDIDIDTDIDTQHSRLMIVDESTDHTTIV